MRAFRAVDCALSDRRILVVSDSSDELTAVRDLLTPELGDYWLAGVGDCAYRLFVGKRPSVVILSFREIDAAEHFCLSLRRCCPDLEAAGYQILLLCRSAEVGVAYALCAGGVVDDYVVNRPLHDVLRFRLSVRQAHDRCAQRRPGRRQEVPLLQPLPPKVLLVEDCPVYKEMISTMLGAAGLRFLHVESGEEALAKMGKWQPDILLLDYRLPGIDGLETLRRLRVGHELASLPVIMLTGVSESSVVDRSIQGGAQGFIVKPSDRNTILGKIFGLLSTSHR